MRIQVLNRVLASNDALANEYRKEFDKNKITAINIMSAPGSGKTALLEQTLKEIKNKINTFVIEGDIKGDLDAQRVAKAGGRVYQINTDGACHLDAFMISQVLPKIKTKKIDLLFIENVGNLVCPAEFYIGAHYNVMLLSTPEGADKPVKYPLMFSKADLLIINKIDLLPYVNFDFKSLEKSLKTIKPSLDLLKISCKTGEGLTDWYQWLASHLPQTIGRKLFKHRKEQG
ncbi:MAG: hydrogenase nickel incorporation protein HypB [Candidatus Latescibacteria bacterium]|nr:hydrogenase nickel incorporation protein HypB [Candidatus Latescibacterota bacterium]